MLTRVQAISPWTVLTPTERILEGTRIRFAIRSQATYPRPAHLSIMPEPDSTVVRGRASDPTPNGRFIPGSPLITCTVSVSLFRRRSNAFTNAGSRQRTHWNGAPPVQEVDRAQRDAKRAARTPAL